MTAVTAERATLGPADAARAARDYAVELVTRMFDDLISTDPVAPGRDTLVLFGNPRNPETFAATLARFIMFSSGPQFACVEDGAKPRMDGDQCDCLSCRFTDLLDAFNFYGDAQVSGILAGRDDERKRQLALCQKRVAGWADFGTGPLCAVREPIDPDHWRWVLYAEKHGDKAVSK